MFIISPYDVIISFTELIKLTVNRLEDLFIEVLLPRKINQLDSSEDSFEQEAISLTNWLLAQGVENLAWESQALSYIKQIHDKCSGTKVRCQHIHTTHRGGGQKTIRELCLK